MPTVWQPVWLQTPTKIDGKVDAMKSLLLLLALCLLIGSVSATSLNFQSGSDMNQINVSWGSSPVTWVESTTGANNYVLVPPKTTTGAYLINSVGSPTAYAAATCISDNGNGVYIKLYDSSGTMIGSEYLSSGAGRYEVIVSGGIPSIYKNGILVSSGAVMPTNPSYVGFGAGGFASSLWDDFVYGADNKYIAGIPEQNAFFIKKDMVNPSASGLYNTTSGTLVSSNTMYTTWGRSNVSYAGNESIYLINADTGTIYETHYTGTASYGTITWDIGTSIIASGAPYGRYQIRFNDYYSTEIAYIADGAEINFDKASYSQQDQAIITYTIDGAYWDTSTYTYAMKIYRGNDWSVASAQSITASSGTFTYTFTTSDTQGEYYAVIEAIPNVGGNAIWMNYDYAALNAYVTFNWCLNNESVMVQSGANVSLSQNSIVSNTITGANGCGNSTGFFTGIPLTINITKPGYFQYYVQFTPMVARTIGTATVPFNFTINSTTPAFTGLGVAGVDRTGVLTGTMITSGYGEPIPSATCYLINQTNGESYSTTANGAGWYKFDETTGAYLTTKRPYDLWCEKIGYSVSPNYTVVTA